MELKSILVSLAFVAASGLFVQAQAQTPAVTAPDAGPKDPGTMTAGEVRKVDKENKKITLKHREIKNLEMPGMTMVFQVKDPALLDIVKAGDKVTFRAEKVGDALVVTQIRTTNP